MKVTKSIKEMFQSKLYESELKPSNFSKIWEKCVNPLCQNRQYFQNGQQMPYCSLNCKSKFELGK